MNRKLLKHPFVLLAFLSTGALACACQVPVFRYALERWSADKYQVLILHDGPLDASLSQALNTLQETEGQSDQRLGPVDLRIFDVGQVQDPRLLKLWADWPDKQHPLLAAYYPAGSQASSQMPAHVDSATAKSIERLQASPVRDAVTERLVKGHSAVWILVTTGQEAQDRVAYETLQKQLELDATWLQLPSAEELEVNAEILEKTKIKLQIQFSIVKLDRKDIREKFLLDTLLNSEADLRSFDAPLAFPVFGRGRVLYALVGNGISADTIRAASSFIVGPCSCQVKDQNPGFDLLLKFDWEAAIGDTLISEPIPGSGGSNLEPTLLKIPPGRASRN